MMIATYKSMPDLHVTIEEMVAEGGKMMCRNIWRFTDTASGQKMQFHGWVLWRYEEEKIAEPWAPSLRSSRNRTAASFSRICFSRGTRGQFFADDRRDTCA
jgi:hypothetical protein